MLALGKRALTDIVKAFVDTLTAVTLCRLSSALIPAAFYLCTRMQYWQ